MTAGSAAQRTMCHRRLQPSFRIRSVEQMDATFGVLCEARIVRVVIYDYG
jgi:hypothetical protein